MPGTGTAVLEAYWSNDGVHFQPIADSGVTLHSGDALYSGGNAGVAATSDSSGYSSTASMYSVTVWGSPLYDVLPAECAPGYSCAPVGGIAKWGQWAAPGSTWSSSPWTVEGSGSGLVNGATTDGLHFISQPMSGDGSVSETLGPGYQSMEAMAWLSTGS